MYLIVRSLRDSPNLNLTRTHTTFNRQHLHPFVLLVLVLPYIGEEWRSLTKKAQKKKSDPSVKLEEEEDFTREKKVRDGGGQR